MANNKIEDCGNGYSLDAKSRRCIGNYGVSVTGSTIRLPQINDQR